MTDPVQQTENPSPANRLPPGTPGWRGRITKAVCRAPRHILSPVYFKELVQIALSRRTTITKAIFLFVLLATSGLVMLPRQSQDSTLGLILFTTVAYVELILVLFITPIATAGAVAGERQANTLDLLFLTRLTTWNIVQDKGLSRISYMLYLCSLTFPFMFGAMLFGGIEIFQVLQTITAIVSTVIFCGGIGVITSSFSKSYVTALVKCYVLIILSAILLPIIVGIITGGRSPWAIIAVSPFLAIAVAINPWMRGPGGMAAMAWPVMLGGSIGFYLLAVLLSSIRLRRDRQKHKPQAGTVRARIYSWKDYFKWLQPARLYDFRSHHVGQFPIVWKNAGFAGHRLKSVLSNLWMFVLAVTAGLLLYIAVESESFDMFESGAFYWVLAGIFMPLTALFTIILGAESFTSDWHAKRMTLLLASRIPARQFVYGTLFSLVRSCLMTWAIPLSFLAVGSIVSMFNSSRYDDVEFFAPLFFVTLHMMFFLVLGMHMSLWLKRTALSIALTLLIALVIIFGPLLLAGIIGTVGMVLGFEHSDAFEALLKMAMMLSPAFWEVISCSKEITEEILIKNYDTGVIMLFLQVVLFATATIGGIFHLGRRFDRICGRQSGGKIDTGLTASDASASSTELPKTARFGSTPPPLPDSVRPKTLPESTEAEKGESAG